MDLGRITYPTTVDDPTKSLIHDWFQYREVCDNEKFNTFFNRTLNTSMRKYRQLLRIQPGEVVEFDDGVERVVTYDWMIQEYHELQHETSVEGEMTESISGDNSVTRNTTDEGTKTTTMVGDDQTAKSGMTSVTQTGTTSGATGNVTTQDLEDRTTGTTTTDTATGQSNTTDHDGDNSSNDKSLGKAAPQSISYSGGSGMPSNLDWQYPSSQSEVDHTGEDNYTEDGTTSTSGTSETEVNDTVTRTGDTTSSGTSETESQSVSEGTNAEGIEFDTERMTAESDSRAGVQTESGATSSGKMGSNSTDTMHREMSQGRNIDIATLLDNAKNFILGSSAWDYLYGQLDKLFISIYND